ncbi:hypothetical protein MTR67_023692 [Solanum verrucosum]|uniref:Uncharacterized protein n=1 Tax=Solanum verrucosum TaxID=315347 RepID=A0AAF0TRM5_SOLVR|nr:hypothetical protein MTR67_023692 [Solanum verrucosum]
MDHLAQSVDVHASRVEAVVPGLIERAITAVLDPIRVELREHRELITAHGLALDALTVQKSKARTLPGKKKRTKLNISKASTHQSHSVTDRVDLRLAKSFSRTSHG